MGCEEYWQSKESNVKDVFISFLIGREQKRLNDKLISVNATLKWGCKLNELGFIDNSNICSENLFDVRLRLSNDSMVILANDFIYALNRLILWNKNFYNSTCKNDFLLQAIFIAAMMSFSISQKVLK